MKSIPFSEMTNEQLIEAHTIWQWRVLIASGWSSAYFAATTLAQVVREGAKREIKMSNPYPVRKG